MIHSVTLRREMAADAAMSEWVAPDGWRHRRFDWHHPSARGRILVKGGRADIIEKYLETIAHLHEQGWSVTAFDWRGQGGSGRLAADPHVGHATSFNPWVADLGAFWREWRVVEEPAVMLGHSMGAHLALRAMLDGGIDPDAAVLVAPMIAVRSPLGAAAGLRVAGMMTRLGDPARPAWSVRPDKRSAGHRQQLLTHSVERFEDEAYWYARDPSLLLGPPSWAWVLEAFVSGERLQADTRLAGLAVPILMLVADAGGLVDSRAAVRLAAKLPNVALVRLGRESAHEILREDDAVRLHAYATMDAFLDKHA